MSIKVTMRNEEFQDSVSMHIDHDNLVLETESDVEQKIIMPLLVGEAYLGIPSNKVFTKSYLAPSILDKKADRKSGYYPDYAVFMRSFPVLIVEAKAPDVPPEVGYREAGLYAKHPTEKQTIGVEPVRLGQSDRP
jgi:type I site-specific restriction endonuclease